MDIFVNGQKYSIQNPPDWQPIAINAHLAQAGTGRFTKPFKIYLDTCASGLVLPEKLLKDLGIFDHLDKLGNQVATNADGRDTNHPVLAVDLKFSAIPSGQTIIIQYLPAMVAKGGDMALLGLDVLALMNIIIKGGLELVLLDFDTKVVAKIQR